MRHMSCQFRSLLFFFTRSFIVYIVHTNVFLNSKIHVLCLKRTMRKGGFEAYANNRRRCASSFVHFALCISTVRSIHRFNCITSDKILCMLIPAPVVCIRPKIDFHIAWL